MSGPTPPGAIAVFIFLDELWSTTDKELRKLTKGGDDNTEKFLLDRFKTTFSRDYHDLPYMFPVIL